jgi:hypothetical protein
MLEINHLVEDLRLHQNKVLLHKVDIKDCVADVLTKSIVKEKFKGCRASLELVDP